MGHTSGMASIRYGAFIILDQGGTDVLYFNDDNGVVFAADAATGAPFVGWQTDPLDPATYSPVALSGNPLKSGASDGTNLYYATFSAGPGDIYAIDAATGGIAWQLSAGDGLQGPNVGWTAGSNESFQCGVAVDGGQVFASSFMGFPDNGTYYDLSATTGTVNNASQADRIWLSHPIVDVSTVTWPSRSNQIPNTAGGFIAAYSRTTGAVVWASGPFQGNLGFGAARYRTNPSLSCEVDRPDLAFAGNSAGYFSVYDNNTGAEMFHRRVAWTGNANEIDGSALGVDGAGVSHAVMIDQFGGLYDLASTGVNRARFEILAEGVQVPVEFGSPADVVITFPQIYRNSGCADLVLDLVADAASNGGSPNAISGGGGISTVRTRFASSTSSIADQLTAQRLDKIEALRHYAINEPSEVYMDAAFDRNALNLGSGSRNSSSRAASAVPPFLIDANGMGDVFEPPGGGHVTAPGDTSDISVHVVGPLISRGPQSFFVTFQNMNDPDYWLNAGMPGSVTLDPEILLTLVGGCLLDTVGLNFGVGAANFWPAFNTGRLAGFTVITAQPVIDGNANIMFGGTYVYGVSQQRLAMSSDVWSTGAFGNGDYISLQADPNFVSGLCAPDLASGVMLGEISADGLTYVPITGDVVSRSWIDSV
ncbi:MAG: PQQ-binding-like beta-propeller repeat protein, partial [Candidatus Zixiibacteriota bacterium]